METIPSLSNISWIQNLLLISSESVPTFFPANVPTSLHLSKQMSRPSLHLSRIIPNLLSGFFWIRPYLLYWIIPPLLRISPVFALSFVPVLLNPSLPSLDLVKPSHPSPPSLLNPSLPFLLKLSQPFFPFRTFLLHISSKFSSKFSPESVPSFSPESVSSDPVPFFSHESVLNFSSESVPSFSSESVPSFSPEPVPNFSSQPSQPSL